MKNKGSASKYRAKKKPNILKTFKRDWQLYLLVLPAVIVVFIFNYIPMYGVQLAFRDFDFTAGITGGTFRGLFYFRQFFDSFLFSNIMKNTVVISLTTIVVGFPVPIILAIIVNQIASKSRKKVFQTAIYLPYFISVVVLVSLVNILLSPNTGIVGHLFRLLNIEGVNLLADANAFLPVFVISGIWQTAGWNSIIYIAALSGVDQQLYESAKIDGANRFHLIRHIDLPSMVPTMVVLLILSMGNVLTVGFDRIFLMQNATNIGVSEVISTHVYKVGIMSNQFSYAAAVGLFNTSINFVFLVITNFIAKKAADVSLW